jgi:CRP/FNR family transcriptional regulator, cyclic AMP receptor protein
LWYRAVANGLESSPMSVLGNTQRSGRQFDKSAFLRDHPLFRKFPPAVVGKLAAHMTRRTVRRGTTIFSKGDPGNGLLGVITGAVKISIFSVDGQEAVLNVIHDGEIFGEIALLDGRPRTADAVAMTDCELMVVDRRDFLSLLKAEPDIAIQLIEVLCERLRRTSEQVEDVMFLALPVRLAKLLLRLATEGHEGPHSRKELAITQREISKMIGISRESTNKQLRDWARRKWIGLGRGRITIIDAKAIADVAVNL